jgi:hypothetical protein
MANQTSFKPAFHLYWLQLVFQDGPRELFPAWRSSPKRLPFGDTKEPAN